MSRLSSSQNCNFFAENKDFTYAAVGFLGLCKVGPTIISIAMFLVLKKYPELRGLGMVLTKGRNQ